MFRSPVGLAVAQSLVVAFVSQLAVVKAAHFPKRLFAHQSHHTKSPIPYLGISLFIDHLKSLSLFVTNQKFSICSQSLINTMLKMDAFRLPSLQRLNSSLSSTAWLALFYYDYFKD